MGSARIFQSLTIILNGQREQWILWFPVGLAVGVLVYFYLPYEPSFTLTGMFLLLSMVGVYIARRHYRLLFFGFILCSLVACGFALAHFYTWRIEAPAIIQKIGPTWVRGRIVTIEPREHGRRMILEDISIWKFSGDVPNRVRLNVNGPLGDAQPGDRIAVRAVLMPPPPPVYPGAYDFARWAFFKQLGAVGFTLGGVEIKEKDSGFRHRVAQIRFHIAQRINETLLEKSPAHAGIAVALLVGEQGAIPDDVMEAMRETGLGHLLSISGLHLVLVTGISFFFVRLVLAGIPSIVLHYNIKKWAAVLAMAMGFFYLLISGMAVPALRAYIMTGLFFLAVLVDRTGTPMRPAMLAATYFLIFYPSELLGPSFQMSFAASIALIAAYHATPWFRGGGKYSAWQRGGIYVGGVIFSSLVAGAATTPFALYHFGNVAPYSLLANLIAVPLTSLWVMPWGVASLLALPLGLEHVPLTLMALGIDGIVTSATYIHQLPHASMRIPPINTPAVLAVSLGLVWLCFWRGRLRLFGIGFVLLGVVLALTIGTRPHLVIDGRGKLFAMRISESEYVFSNRINARYARELWEQQFGLVEPVPRIQDLPKIQDTIAPEIHLTCDGGICNYAAAGQRVRIVTNKYQGALDYCENIDIVITLHSLSDGTCPGNVTHITRQDLCINGTHALWLSENGALIKTVREHRGKRPWIREGCDIES